MEIIGQVVHDVVADAGNKTYRCDQCSTRVTPDTARARNYNCDHPGCNGRLHSIQFWNPDKCKKS